MKEAIANAGVFNLIIIFVIILMAFFIGSLGYSKAFKVKNKIVEEIEKEEGYTEITKNNIESWLKDVGYRVNPKDGSFSCPSVDNGNRAVAPLTIEGSNYQYCVYELTTCSSSDKARCGTYYRVTAYMYFDFPVIGDLIRIPVTGETKTFTVLNS